MSEKSCLVTGGTGFIGAALVRRLVKEGYRVKVLDNDLRGAQARLNDVRASVEMIQADIRDGKAVRNACKGVNAVCHLAYLNGTEFFYKRPELVLDIGVKGMVNVIDSCIQEGIEELILLSSSEVYQTPPVIPTDEKAPLSIPDPLNPRYSYGGGKIISELMTINYGRVFFKRALVARPHNVYGPDMGWEHVIPQFVVRMKELCKNNKNSKVEFSIQGTGDETRSFVFIDDFIEAFMLMIEKGEHLGIYNIGTQEEVSINKLASEVGAYFGKSVILAPGKAPEGSPKRRCPDITKIKKLGYRPRFSFAEGLNVTVKWYAQNLDKKLFGAKGKIEDEKIWPPHF